MEGKKCVKDTSAELRPLPHVSGYFLKKKKRKKTHCGVKWLRAKGTKPPLIECHDLNVCNMYNRYPPSKGEGTKHAQCNQPCVHKSKDQG